MWLLLSILVTDFTVAPVGGDFSTIQAALDAAQPGDSIAVESGTYGEQIVFPRSGNSGAGPIVLAAADGHQPVIDGTGFVGGNMVLIDGRSHVEMRGFEIRNLAQINDGSGIRIIGSGSDVRILDNHIHHMMGSHAMGITVYGTESTAISDLEIRGNWIHDCEPSQSEALTLNGNIDGFTVNDNLVTDVNNIGIDFIGGETSINPNPALVARHGVCRGNTVKRARSNYGGGYAAGIYVDGGSDILIQANEVSECDLGIEIGAENSGITTSAVIVRSNWVHHNDKVGIVFGGYDASVGRVEACAFMHNTCYFNDTLGEGLGELWIQYASLNEVRGNIFVGRAGEAIHYSELGNVDNTLDFNLWYASGGPPEWVWRGTLYSSFAAFQAGSGEDGSGMFIDPLLVDPDGGDGHLTSSSPARDGGDPAAEPGAVGVLDFDGQSRIVGIIDLGMDELPGEVTCLPSLFAVWQMSAGPCGELALTVKSYVQLVSGTCSCPPELVAR